MKLQMFAVPKKYLAAHVQHENTLLEIRAVTGASDLDLKPLKKAARHLASTSLFSPHDLIRWSLNRMIDGASLEAVTATLNQGLDACIELEMEHWAKKQGWSEERSE